MIRWESLTDEEARVIWDPAQARFADCSPFQSYGWGEYRRALGWEPYRWVAYNEANEIVAMMQAYLRKYFPGIGLIWGEGGPVGDISACNEGLQQVMKQSTGVRHLYCRFRCDRPREIEDVLRLRAQGWFHPWSPLVSGYSMTVDLTRDEKEMLAQCERNWRRNLKRSQECNLQLRRWIDPRADEIVPIYTSMQQAKGLEEQHSREEIEQMVNRLGDQLIVYRCEDKQGELLSVMACAIIGDKACSVLSATCERGRQLHSSYAIFWALLQHCRSLGIREYDLAGIDPAANPGVYRFKRASGAEPVEFLGEWDWASRPWLRWFGNWAIGRRKKIRQAETVLKLSRPAPRDQSSAAIVRAEAIQGELAKT